MTIEERLGRIPITNTSFAEFRAAVKREIKEASIESQNAERERCAQLVDDWMLPIVMDGEESAALELAKRALGKAIRSRA